jgi:hypothetical protein
LVSSESFACAATALDRRARRRAVRLGEVAPAVERARHARGELRIDRVEREHPVGPERVAGAVGAMEAGRVAEAERADQAARAVRVGEVEVGMREQPPDVLEHLAVVLGRARLQREPLVEDERIVAEHRVEALERRVGEHRARAHQREAARPGGRSCCRRP